jgi:hypothetical protein
MSSSLSVPSRAFAGTFNERVLDALRAIWRRVGRNSSCHEVAAKAKLDLSPYKVVPTGDAEESAAVSANLAGSGKAGALMKGSLHTDRYICTRAAAGEPPANGSLAQPLHAHRGAGLFSPDHC